MAGNGRVERQNGQKCQVWLSQQAVLTLLENLHEKHQVQKCVSKGCRPSRSARQTQLMPEFMTPDVHNAQDAPYGHSGHRPKESRSTDLLLLRLDNLPMTPRLESAAWLPTAVWPGLYGLVWTWTSVCTIVSWWSLLGFGCDTIGVCCG